MKHRSIVGFILLAAALFAAPQIAHDLLSLKSAVGARIRGEIVHAILSLGKTDGSEALTAQRANTPRAICEKESGVAQAAPKSKKAEGHATAETRPAAPSLLRDDQLAMDGNQLAMLVSPSLLAEGAGEETPDADADGFDKNIVRGSSDLSQWTPAQGEIAALAPQDKRAVVLAHVGALENAPTQRDRSREEREVAEAQRQLARFAADFAGRKIDAQVSGAPALRRFAATLPASYEFRVEGVGPRVKLLRVRRCGGKDNTAPIIYTWKAARQVAKCSTVVSVPQAPPAE
ncbi:MAG TPA: hypothetical protein VLJ61_18065 [Pyrinomonadaceae bacterium]|nr:hypothetical protein [Pyrinomonadaceae bacterium]